MKKIIVLEDKDIKNIPLAAILVDEDTDVELIIKDIKAVKEKYPYNYNLSDILEGISVNYEEYTLNAIEI